MSKWENGRTMPDSSIMLELCSILKISVNDLLKGEIVSIENYNKELENNLLDMIRQKEEIDKKTRQKTKKSKICAKSHNVEKNQAFLRFLWFFSKKHQKRSKK